MRCCTRRKCSAERLMTSKATSSGGYRSYSLSPRTNPIEWRVTSWAGASTCRCPLGTTRSPRSPRRLKRRITHDKLESMHPADLADIMEELSPAERQAIIASLDEESAAEALAELDSRLTSQIVEKMAPGKAADIIEEMEPDMAADVLGDLSPEVSQDVIEELPGEEAREVEALLSFDENSAGGMMTTDFVYVGETATRAEVVDWIRDREVKV